MILTHTFCNLRHRYIGSNQLKKGCNVQLLRLRSQILNQKTEILYCLNFFDTSISKGLNKEPNFQEKGIVLQGKAPVLSNGKDVFMLENRPNNVGLVSVK